MGEKEGDEEVEVWRIHVRNGKREIVITLSLQISAEIMAAPALALIGADDPAVAAEVS